MKADFLTQFTRMSVTEDVDSMRGKADGRMGRRGAFVDSEPSAGQRFAQGFCLLAFHPEFKSSSAS